MSTLNSNPIAKAVRTALLAGTAAALAMPSVYAAEDEDKGEKVTITGSRIKRTDIEGPTPVTVIDRETIEMSGQNSVADVLRNTTYNSFGSYRETSGNTFQSQALVDMRGLGSGRTLVLLNGRRVPNSPVTGNAAADLNSLPLEAVERIEILSDSASAVYGSDAIGGVINIILRNDYDGASVSLSGHSPTREGGDRESVAVTLGGTSDKGSYVFTMEKNRKDIIFSRERHWTDVDYGEDLDGNGRIDIGTTEGISPWGNTMLFIPAFWGLPSEFTPNGRFVQYEGYAPNCDNPPAGTEYFGVMDHPSGSACGYPYALISAETNDLERTNMYFSAEYEVNEDLKFYSQQYYSNVQSFGRYAPPVGLFYVDGSSPFNPWPGEVAGFYLGHRFQAHGPRDDRANNNVFDSTIGLTGFLSNGEFEWDLSFRHNSYDSNIRGDTYINTALAEMLVATGYDFDFNGVIDPATEMYNPFDPLNNSEQVINMMGHTTHREITNDFNVVNFSINGDMFELPAGTSAFAAGVEYRTEEFQDRYDAGRIAGNVIGSSGASSAGDRKHFAAFGEFLFPIIDDLEATVAVRYDDFKDTGGDKTTPQIALRYQPMDNLLVRASWGKGFRAPNMSDLFSAPAQSFNDAADYVGCAQTLRDNDPNNDITRDNCPVFQYENATGGNPELFPEESESFNFGIVYQPLEELTLTLDTYNIELTGVIQSNSIQNLILIQERAYNDLLASNPNATNAELLAAMNAALPPGVSVPRVPSTLELNSLGVINNAVANVARREVSGSDFRVNYALDMDDLGRLDTLFQWSYIDEYITQASDFDTPSNIIGGVGVPRSRANVSLLWTMGDHRVSTNLQYIGHQVGNFTNDQGNSEYGELVKAYTKLDLQYSWSAPWNAIVSVGVLNVTDEDPAKDRWGEVYYDSNMYDIDGRVPYIKYTQNF